MRGVIAFTDQGDHRVLEGAEAALWDLIRRGYGVESATRMIAAIDRMDDADRFVRRCLAEWREAGLHG